MKTTDCHSTLFSITPRPVRIGLITKMVMGGGHERRDFIWSILGERWLKGLYKDA